MATAKSEEALCLDDVSGDWSEVRGARGYALWLDSRRSHRLVGKLYASFLHHVAAPDLSLYVLFATSRSRVSAELLSSIGQAAPPIHSHKLERKEMREMGLETWKSGPFYELMLRTRSFEVLDLLFSYGDLYVSFWTWIIDSEEAEFPTDALRRLNFGREKPTLMDETLARYLGMVRLEEFHGPVVLTRSLRPERIRGAAERTAYDLGLPLRTRLS